MHNEPNVAIRIIQSEFAKIAYSDPETIRTGEPHQEDIQIAKRGHLLLTEPSTILPRGSAPRFPNVYEPQKRGPFRGPKSRIVASMNGQLQELWTKYMPLDYPFPSFREAGPQELLAFNLQDPHFVLKVMIVTTGGLAPGLNRVTHSLVDRVYGYKETHGCGLEISGFRYGLKGVLKGDSIPLTREVTGPHMNEPGSFLGSGRTPKSGPASDRILSEVASRIMCSGFHLVFLIGGDGTMMAAHKLHLLIQKLRAGAGNNSHFQNPVIVGIPKTIDNDLLWIDKSFGYETAVQEAAKFIRLMRKECEQMGRVGLVTLMGARSGFIAGKASMVAGSVDLCLVDEVHHEVNWKNVAAYIERVLNEHGHALIVIAEGMIHSTLLDGKRDELETMTSDDRRMVLAREVDRQLARHKSVSFDLEISKNDPGCLIRGVAPGAFDCSLALGLSFSAVDSALAGFTDFMVGSCAGKLIMVPLATVVSENATDDAIGGVKRIHRGERFWSEVISTTGQDDDYLLRSDHFPAEKSAVVLN